MTPVRYAPKLCEASEELFGSELEGMVAAVVGNIPPPCVNKRLDPVAFNQSNPEMRERVDYKTLVCSWTTTFTMISKPDGL